MAASKPKRDNLALRARAQAVNAMIRDYPQAWTQALTEAYAHEGLTYVAPVTPEQRAEAKRAAEAEKLQQQIREAQAKLASLAVPESPATVA